MIMHHRVLTKEYQTVIRSYVPIKFSIIIKKSAVVVVLKCYRYFKES